MSSDEYNYIVQVVNENAYERTIFLRIRAELECCGTDIRQIPYEYYLHLREEKCREGNASSVLRVSCSQRQYAAADPPRIPEHVRNAKEEPKEERLSREEIYHIISVLLVAGVLIGAGIIIESIALPIWCLAICILGLGLADYFPYPENYDADYVHRYIKAQEDARLFTRAMIDQAYLHSSELKILNDKINRKK